MAVPIIPLVIVGMGLLVLGRRKRPAKKKAEGELPAVPFHTVVFLPPKEPAAPTGPSGQAGRPCEGKGGDGAFDELGSCKTFWVDGDTDEAIGRLAREEWEARGRPRASEMCFMVDDPLGGELSTPKANPIFVEITAAALERYYDVGALFPPKVATQFDEPVSPYWVQKAWAKASAVVRRELCEA